jgi:hypothetical protein
MSDYQANFRESDICVAAFASLDGLDLGELSHFEFGKTLYRMGVAYVLFRDSTGYRQLYGVQGIGDRAAVVRYLLTVSNEYRRLVLVGLSAGAMAAMLYGQLMADVADVSNVEVLAISPYSHTGDVDLTFGENWRTRSVWGLLSEGLNDLVPYFKDGPKVKIRAFVSNGVGTEIDWFHASRIGVNDVTFVPGAGHSSLAKLMRDMGLLQRAIRGEPL